MRGVMRLAAEVLAATVAGMSEELRAERYCDGCGELVAAHDRVWIEHHNGKLRAAALRDLDPEEHETVDRAWHGGCTVRPRRTWA
jgi:hypothetical protein